ncbi:MAG: ABC transporter permease [Bacteroidota bacterium]|nr:ABC transporter permease [Bacteroidota bacterium]
MRQVFYLMQKEFRQIVRDRFMIALLFVAPLVLIFVLGNAVTTEVLGIRMVFYDGDRTPFSRELLAHFRDSRYFRIVGYESRYRELTRLMDRGEAQVAVVLPAGFQRDILRGSAPTVQVLVDALDGNSAGVALGYVTDIVRRFHKQAAVSMPLPVIPTGGRRVAAETRFWYNPNLESRVFIIPGIMAILLVITTVLLTSLGIVREKEIGTLEQLMVTPIRSWQLIAGKTLPFCVVGFIAAILCMVFIRIIFGIGIAGSILLLAVESVLFILTTLGMGILVSTISHSQQQALFIAWFFMIFGMILSGFFIPIANMPPLIQVLTYANPVRYYMTILREIYLKGTGLSDLVEETVALAVFGTVVFSAAVLRFRRTLR